jgi:hypothetical protein
MRRLVVLLRGTAVTTFFAVAGPLVGFTLFVAWIYFNTPLERRYLPRFSEWISSVQELGIPCAVAGALFFVVHVLASSRMRSALWLPVLGAVSMGSVFAAPMAISLLSGGSFRSVYGLFLALAVVCGTVIGALVPRALLYKKSSGAAS